ncbi:hypothetical protein ACROYT_G034238 [Oculina patagonica]
MYVLTIAFALVFLGGFCSALPNIYNRTFEGYYCNVRKCTTAFYKNLQNDASAICELQYHLAAACVGKVFYGCVGNFLTQNKSRAVLNQVLINEKKMCIDGPLDAFANPIKSHPDVNMTCTGDYSQKFAMCGKTLQQKFVANPSDASLCGEYATAKKCVKDLLPSECTFNSQDEEAFNFQLDDYNPFCGNNRDPGATGSAHCSDSQVVPTTAVPCNKSNAVFSRQFILFFALAAYLVFMQGN